MGEFNEPKNRPNAVTREYIDQKFEIEFKKTGNRILMEDPFKKVAEHYVAQNVPAYMRTRKALMENSDYFSKLETELNKFLVKMETGKIGWFYCKKTNGSFYLKYFDEEGQEFLIDSASFMNRVVSNSTKFRNFMGRQFLEEKSEQDGLNEKKNDDGKTE